MYIYIGPKNENAEVFPPLNLEGTIIVSTYVVIRPWSYARGIVLGGGGEERRRVVGEWGGHVGM